MSIYGSKLVFDYIIKIADWEGEVWWNHPMHTQAHTAQKWSFTWKISLINVEKQQVPMDLVMATKEILNPKMARKGGGGRVNLTQPL